jgi:hypothetical protein
MFAYCRNKPVSRRDLQGTGDEDLNYKDINEDGDPLNDAGVTRGSHAANPRGNSSASGTSGSAKRTQALIKDITTKLRECAKKSNLTYSGKGPRIGTLKHSKFKGFASKLNINSLKLEASYVLRNGKATPTYYGEPGSIRFDAVLVDDSGDPIYAWDFKTGNALLTPSRISHMHNASGLIIPIEMVK